MKIVSKIILSMTFALLMTLAFTSYVQAQSMNLGGATGLISTPTAHTGWEGKSVALDLGYHYIKDNGKGSSSLKGNYSIPKALVYIGFGAASLELGGAYDIQPEVPNIKTNDILFNGKFAFTAGRGSSATNIAIGGSYQRMELNFNDKTSADKQIYLAATYPGSFFTLPAETTIVVGHTWYGSEHKKYRTGSDDNKNIDFSMGFDLNIKPTNGIIHWINDFANYSYSTEAGGADAWTRGCFNTGIRIDPLKAIRANKRFKFNIDIIMTDALDANRGWAVGGTFGLMLF